MKGSKAVISVEWIEARLSEIEEHIAELKARKAVFEELLVSAPRIVSSGDKPTKNDVDAGAGGGGSDLDPSTAIDALVEREPGLTRREVADRVEDIVASNAQNVRAVLFTHMRRREQSGDYYKDPKGRLFPKNHPVAVQARQKKGSMQSGVESVADGST